MKDKVFFDTNTLIYLYSSDDIDKRDIVIQYLKSTNAVISTQVVNELCNVLLKKSGLPTHDVKLILENIATFIAIVDVSMNHITQGLLLKERDGYSYYDSLILSTALLEECKYVFTEDMHSGQVINNKVTIKNIFH